MKISVLIPTLGRDRELIDSIRGLTQQTVVPDEIVVVDQNQPAFPEVDRFLASIPNVRHIRSDTPGYARNLNVGLREARGDILIILDDDIVPSPKLIEMHRDNYIKADPKLGGVAGRVEQRLGDQDPKSIRHFAAYHPVSGTVVANFNATDRREVTSAIGANMSFKRQLLLDLGGFDLGFDGNGYRCEADLCLRVISAGYRIIFDPRAEIKHLMAPAGGCRVHDKSISTYYYVKNGIRLYRRHSPSWGQPLIVAKMASYVAAKAAYNLQWKILSKGMQAIWNGIREPMELVR